MAQVNMSGILRVPRQIAWRLRGGNKFTDSSSYWEQRYKSGGNSGAGSYGRLADFKAEIINDIVAKEDIESVVELGSGDGAQLALASYPTYVGLDVSQQAVQHCRQKFADDATKSFHLFPDELGDLAPADLAMSLDVIYHLVEDDVFENYMAALFGLAKKVVIVYSSNVDQGHHTLHVKHREFTKWVADNAPQWQLEAHIPNRFPAAIGKETSSTSFADFYVFRPTSA